MGSAALKYEANEYLKQSLTEGFDFAKANVPKAQTTDPRSLGERSSLDWDVGDFLRFYLRFLFVKLPQYFLGVALASAQGLLIYGSIFAASILIVASWRTGAFPSLSWRGASIAVSICCVAYLFFLLLNARDLLWRYQPVVPTWHLLGPRSLISRFLRIQPNDLHFGFLNVRYAFNTTTFFIISGDTLAACAIDFSLMKKARISNDPRWRGSFGTLGVEIPIAGGTKSTKLNIHGSYFEDGVPGSVDRDEFIELLNSRFP